MTGVLPNLQMRRIEARSSAPLPEPDVSALDVMGAEWRLAGDRTGWEREQVANEARNAILGAIHDDDPAWYDRHAGDLKRRGRNIAQDAFAVLAAKRREKPGFLPEIAVTRDAYEQQLIERQKLRRSRDIRIAGGADGLIERGAGFLGGAGGAILKDPINIGATVATGGLGRAGTLLGEMVLNGAINAGIEAVEQPLVVAPEMKRLDEPVTAASAARDIGMAFVGGAVISGALRGTIDYTPRAIDVGRDLWERALAKNWDRLPAPVRERWANAASIPDGDIADVAELLIGRDNLTPDEAATISVFRRESQIDSNSPFVPNGAGVARHRESLGEAMDRILSDLPPSRPRDLRASVSPAALDAGGARAQIKARIGSAESGGDALARNPRSSATGLYQFTRATWLGLYKRRFGARGMSDDAIAALRSDRRLQNVLMDDLLADNAAFLRSQGEAESAGNLYLTHFAGKGGAKRIFDADPLVPVEYLLGREAVAANPFLKDMTAADLIRWAHGKMGEDAPAPSGARTILAGEAVSAVEATGRSRVQRALDAMDAEDWAVRSGQAGDSEFTALPPPVDGAPFPPPIERATVDIIPSSRPVEPAASRAPALPDSTLHLLPDLRAIVADRGERLGKLDRLAKKLDADIADVKRGLDQLAAEGHLRATSRGYVRPPQEGPVDALKFIARRGGLHPKGEAAALAKARGGHDLATLFEDVRSVVRKTKNGNTRYEVRAPHFVPGAGPIVRESGMFLDRAGELLHEAGYFGPPSTTPRPSTSDVLDLLERSWRSGEKRFPIGDEPRSAPPDDDEWLAFVDRHNSIAQEQGWDLEPDIVAQWARLTSETGLDPVDSFAEMVNRELDGARYDGLSESDKIEYERDYGNSIRDTGTQDRGGADGGAGRGPDTGNPGAQRAGGEDGPDAAWDGWEPESLEGWDDPAGPTATAQADSIVHDIRAEIDPAIADRQRQEMQLRAQSPLQGGAKTGQAQDGEMGLGLFDAADQPEFRLEDGDGPTTSARDLLASIDEEEAIIKTIRDCL